MPDPRLPPAADNLLVIKVRGLGDTLLATPALRALRQAYPRAGLSVLVSAAGREVLSANPYVDRVMVMADKGWPAALRLMAELRSFHYDGVMALHASLRTALLGLATGAGWRVVHNHSGRNFFATIPIAAPKVSKSAIERDLDAVRALGVPDDGADLDFPLSTEDLRTAKEYLEDHGVAPHQPFWVLAPGAGKAHKACPLDLAVKFLRLARQRFPGPWVLLAGQAEEETARLIQRELDDEPVIFNQSLRQAGALFRLSAGVVTADSGPKHVAVAVGAKTLTLWTDEPLAEWHPYAQDQHAVVRSQSGRVADIGSEDLFQAAVHHFLKG
ncbi:MAG: glycosyltransferase family 9 protein [candidate division FCPU426 bacterium]